ncbi:helix-turn-helix transcriptional regulator [Pseudomonas vanderleydeniana]|uniref:Helix-turn-helix transcriptional regulator n=1 Tax=Pseudomonas vanderleydeniana TaxID=2745495 RepID=A0A9E6TTE3_9PSED|nr:helix-turn-helix transcriptional regulator [Pseudomonas vanderleydeniana]QXI30598.1 helix-turn-helix transcriptional regulator [Pseudomonas vanderleydeniana]
MNSQLLFPHIGKVIASTGSRSFPRMLHDLILTQLAVDATHIRKLPMDSESSPTSASTDNQMIGHIDLITSASNAKESALHLTRRKDDCSYTISVYRSNQSQRFSAQEQSILQDFSPLLLPMVEKHITALQPQPAVAASPAGSADGVENLGLQTLRLRFNERLSQSGLALSNREMEVCIGLLSGRTAPELAEQLQLKVNTVESYLKRAAIKMGISGRHSLMRWMYAAEEIQIAPSPL